ncbi:MAG: hypothetical protein B7Z81_06190, partial [Acidocella sp. 20-61-6]
MGWKMNLKISTAIRAFGVVICLGFVAIAAMSSFALMRLEVSGPVYHQISNSSGLLEDIEPSPLYLVEAYLDANLAVQDAQHLGLYSAKLAKLHQRYTDRLDYWRKASLPAGLKKELLVTSDSYAQKFWQAIDGQLLPAIASGDQESIQSSMESLGQIFNADKATIQDIVAKANKFNDDTQKMAASEVRLAHYVMMAVTAIAVLLVLIGLFVMSSQVLKPINQMVTSMKRLAQGDYQTPVPFADRSNEIGGMAQAVQVFKDAGLEKQRLEEAARLGAAQAEAARARHEAEREAAAQQQQFVVESVATGLEKLSGGDLLFRLTDAFSSEYEKLRGDFNAAMETLQQTMQAIAANAQGVRSG